MTRLIRAPLIALLWEISLRNRRWIWSLIGTFLFGWVFNFVVQADALNVTLTFASLLIVFAIFNYTEYDARRDRAGFPDRLFTLPVSTLLLVAAPVGLGVVAVEVVYLAWVKLVAAEVAKPALAALLLGAFMVLYQSTLWIFARFGALRMVVLGLVGVGLIVVNVLSSFPEGSLSPWLSENILSAATAAFGLAGFFAAWTYVARQRSGGAARRALVNTAIEHITDALPRRTMRFRSPGAAQFWFEWRGYGFLFPLCIAGLLFLVIAPLSWLLRNDADSTLRILTVTLSTPVLLALPFGKGFSKPDFWSTDLSLPDFVAVRPLASGEIVIIKLKVAALSAAVSWFLVLGFLSIWLPLWANHDGLIPTWTFVRNLSENSISRQYAFGALPILAGMFITWRFLVSGMWIGLSGNRKFFAASAAPFALVPALAVIGFIMLLRNQSRLVWVADNLDWLLACFGLAVILKFWLWAFSWRDIRPESVRQYFFFWVGSTLFVIGMATFLWRGLQPHLPPNAYGFGLLLILIALLVIPLARIGLAPSALVRNRHR
jgi:hypothetical protein